MRVELREPLLTAFRRIYAAVLDDLPKTFMLEPGNPERQERLPLPATAVREVLVNALTHRDYRVPATIQVIRFRDRIEVRNPGYSLVPEESFGEPGSQPRNPRLADVFREMRLAENKGTGIGAVRRTMDSAGLTPPVFESDRRNNRFVATLWLHNLIDDDDAAWLRAIAPEGLSNPQAQAMVVARRTGAVRNAQLRDISRLDTLGASLILRQLRDRGLLESKGSGVATHYVLGSAAKSAAAEPVANRGELGTGLSPNRGELGADRGELDRHELDADRNELGADRHELGTDRHELEADRQGLPADLELTVRNLGPRPRQEALRQVIVRLCALKR